MINNKTITKQPFGHHGVISLDRQRLGHSDPFVLKGVFQKLEFFNRIHITCQHTVVFVCHLISPGYSCGLWSKKDRFTSSRINNSMSTSELYTVIQTYPKSNIWSTLRQMPLVQIESSNTFLFILVIIN